MSHYDSLVGQSFVRNGARLTIVECKGATVIATTSRNGRIERMAVPLGEVLGALEVPEITMTELPRTGHDLTR